MSRANARSSAVVADSNNELFSLIKKFDVLLRDEDGETLLNSPLYLPSFLSSLETLKLQPTINRQSIVPR